MPGDACVNPCATAGVERGTPAFCKDNFQVRLVPGVAR
jgi:hypothetical protein